MATNSPYQQRTGLLDLMGQGDSSFAGWLDTRRNSLMGFAAGLVGHDTARERMAGAAQGLMQGHQQDTAYARLMEEQKRLQDTTMRYANLFRSWGPDFEGLAAAVEGGAIDPGDAWSQAFDLKRSMADDAATLERNRKNAAFLTDPQLRQMVEAGALGFADAFEMQRDGLTPPDLPASVDEYNWWAAQESAAGREPLSYLDFIQSQKGNGLSITTADGTVITQGGGRFGQTVDAGLGKEFVTLQQDALAAMGGLNTLDAMEQAMADPGFYSGLGSDQVLGLKRAAAAIGIDPEGVTSMESFNALAKQSALDLMGGSLGTGFSNADRDFINQQVPNLENTPEGNRKLIEIQRKIAERKIEIAQLAEQYRLAHGKLDGGFVDLLAGWSEQNPLFQQSPAEAFIDMGGGVTIRQID